MEKTRIEKSSKGKAALDKAKKWQGKRKKKRSENEKKERHSQKGRKSKDIESTEDKEVKVLGFDLSL